MKSITNLNILTKKPKIFISHKGLEAIKHVVNIAPEEAQWFHTIKVLNENELHLSERIYIPTQNTSAAEVNSTSSMLVEFYKEISSNNTIEETNDILNNMGCWSHSHHNMGVSPSHQDEKQFITFVNNSIEQDQKTWQLMLIFNKKQQYYCRAYDPISDVIYEGLDIILNNSYDFSYIDLAAKAKFLKPKFPKAFNKTSNKSYWSAKTNWLFEEEEEQQLLLWEKRNQRNNYELLAENAFEIIKSKTIKFNNKNFIIFLKCLKDILDEKEIFLFTKLLKKNYKQALKSWNLQEIFFEATTDEIELELHNALKNKVKSKKFFINKLSNFLCLLEVPNTNLSKEMEQLF
jgi:hypothetical protein